MTSDGSGRTVPAASSPFFAPSTPHVTVTEQTPGGTKRKIKRQKNPQIVIAEHKTGLFGCSANLVNAIVGSGIVGIPYAMKQSGFLAGVFLVLVCALLTDKSLRLLVATAKHVRCPSYETAAEAAFGIVGFRFIALNMLILAYGAMLSYLMIVKDSFSALVGVESDNKPVRRAILLVVSLAVMVPLASKRDMADLAFTSRLSVAINTLLVFLVAYEAPTSVSFESIGRWEGLFHRTVHFDTVFVGLGVLSFAFVCQHSAFIIAGSMEKPTNDRWSIVTGSAVSMSCALALICGVSGYLGFLDETKGNVLKNFDDDNWKTGVAKSMLGISMLFVYPMESFVARHACVVLFFAGRRAHEGEDTTILNRRDRRVGLTVLLYVSAVIPAAAFDDLGPVLAITGAVGGSCLSYIGPGLIYLGVHGERFLELVDKSWFNTLRSERQGRHDGSEKNPRGEANTTTTATTTTTTTTNTTNTTTTETTPLVHAPLFNVEAPAHTASFRSPDSIVVRAIKWLVWFMLGMPVWCWLATVGKGGLVKHDHEMAMKSPHPIRIGDVSRMRSRTSSAEVEKHDHRVTFDSTSAAFMIAPGQQIIRHNSFTTSAKPLVAEGGTATVDLPSPSFSTFRNSQSSRHTSDTPKEGVGINEMLGRELVQKRKIQEQQGAMAALEKDPQSAPARWSDFFIAIFYILFGMLALIAGVLSLLKQGSGPQ